VTRRGEFKYICLECKAGTYFTRNERTSAAGMRCGSCGSRALMPCRGSEAKKRMLDFQEARNDARKDDMGRPVV